MYRPKWTLKSKIIWILLLIGLCAMEVPGVFFFKDMIDPFIFGFPFIYGYVICWWIFMCVVLFIAFMTNWGRERGNKS